MDILNKEREIHVIKSNIEKIKRFEKQQTENISDKEETLFQNEMVISTFLLYMERALQAFSSLLIGYCLEKNIPLPQNPMEMFESLREEKILKIEEVCIIKEIADCVEKSIHDRDVNIDNLKEIIENTKMDIFLKVIPYFN